MTPGGPGTATVRTSATTRLRVRSGPATSYPIVARLDNGAVVSLLGRDASGGWLLLAVPGQDSPFGWASATYLATSANLAQLPVSTVTTPADGGAPPAPAVPPAATATRSSLAVTPAPGNLPGKLAVPVFDPNAGIYNIWLVDANGANLRRLVENASSPALSADGTLLAYRHWQRDDRGIVVANSDGSNPWRVTDKLEDVLPSFSPDKSKIVFSTYRQGDRRSRIYYVWTDEQNRRAWEWGAGGLFGEDPDWMADGQIAYHTSGERAQLWLMNGDATNQRSFFAVIPPGAVAAIAAAPDSRSLAYMGDGGGSWDIYTVGVDGENARRLTDDPANDGLPAWSPDGESIAFVSDRSGQWGLWVMDADGKNQRLLAYLPGPVDGRVQFEPDYLNHGWLEEQIAWSR
jgi:Tol biopolymer transport system component